MIDLDAQIERIDNLEAVVVFMARVMSQAYGNRSLYGVPIRDHINTLVDEYEKSKQKKLSDSGP